MIAAQSDLVEVVGGDPSGIDILLAPPRVEMAEMVTVRDVEKVLSLLKRVYNIVIIDTPTIPIELDALEQRRPLAQRRVRAIASTVSSSSQDSLSPSV